jgi:uncharacterized membrane protein YedE/YeeE
VTQTGARAYANPYIAGIGLGLVLLSAYVFAGRGLGASGAFAMSASALAATVAPETASRNPYFAGYLASASSPLTDWLVIELAGVVLGGFLSAFMAGRLTRTIARGPRVTPAMRVVAAFAGGGVMGAGAVLARGCTSGQALSGGALLSVGSWLFVCAAFAAAYAGAPAVRRLWR